MTLVFLDVSTLDRGDIDFASLEQLGDLIVHQTTSAAKAPERCANAHVVITNKVPVGTAVLDAAPDVKLVVSAATGVNQIDLQACRQRGVAVANVPGYSTQSVVQHTFAFILELATRVTAYSARVRRDWPTSPIFTRLDHPLVELYGKTLGIIGLGTIGSAVAEVGRIFGMKVISLAREGSPTSAGIPRLEEPRFLARADMISLHCPLTQQNRHFINSSRLAAMKPGAFLINTARGPLIDEPALADALRAGALGGAGLDVLSVEPPPPDHPLLAPDIPNLLISPHTAWTTHESRCRLLAGIVSVIKSFTSGERLNRIV